jgi:hypothetical protein
LLAIAAHDESDDDRRYYRLTPKGLTTAKAEAQRLSALVDWAASRKLLSSAPASRLLASLAIGWTIAGVSMAPSATRSESMN